MGFDLSTKSEDVLSGFVSLKIPWQAAVAVEYAGNGVQISTRNLEILSKLTCEELVLFGSESIVRVRTLLEQLGVKRGVVGFALVSYVARNLDPSTKIPHNTYSLLQLDVSEFSCAAYITLRHRILKFPQGVF